MYKNYRLIKEENIKEINSKAQLLEHVKSGARVVLLLNDDENKVFQIGFKTPPTDDTGVPHIMEHSTLCGSKKYPVKEPFVELLKGSLNTFLNAITFSDKTIYPVAAHKTARAYVPYEQLAFTGKNADKNHTMTLEESIYTPSELAAKMIPAQKAFKRYWNDEPDISILNELIAAEKDYPEICDITFESHFILMCKFCSAQERADFVDSNRKYVFSLDEKSELVNYVTGVYFNDLIRTYQPEKLISVYKALPNSLQTNEDNYFNYGYANYLMSNICSTVLERDIYISRAVNVFNQLKKRGYDNGNFINCWLNVVESL